MPVELFISIFSENSLLVDVNVGADVVIKLATKLVKIKIQGAP